MSLPQEPAADNDSDYIYIPRTTLYAVIGGLVGLIVGLVAGHFLTLNAYDRAVDDAVAAIDDAVADAFASNGGSAGTASAVDDIADDDPSIGPADAPVTIVEFSDFFCPYCATFKTDILPQILEEYGDQVRFVYRDFPAVGGTEPAEAAQCAGDQGAYWEYHDALFDHFRENTSTDDFVALAESLNLDGDEMRDCLETGKYSDEWGEDLQDARALGVTGTPTFFINGTQLVGVQPFENFKQVIDAALAQQ